MIQVALSPVADPAVFDFIERFAICSDHNGGCDQCPHLMKCTFIYGFLQDWQPAFRPLEFINHFMQPNIEIMGCG